MGRGPWSRWDAPASSEMVRRAVNFSSKTSTKLWQFIDDSSRPAAAGTGLTKNVLLIHPESSYTILDGLKYWSWRGWWVLIVL